MEGRAKKLVQGEDGYDILLGRDKLGLVLWELLTYENNDY